MVIPAQLSGGSAPPDAPPPPPAGPAPPLEDQSRAEKSETCEFNSRMFRIWKLILWCLRTDPLYQGQAQTRRQHNLNRISCRTQKCHFGRHATLTCTQRLCSSFGLACKSAHGLHDAVCTGYCICDVVYPMTAFIQTLRQHKHSSSPQ